MSNKRIIKLIALSIAIVIISIQVIATSNPNEGAWSALVFLLGVLANMYGTGAAVAGVYIIESRRLSKVKKLEDKLLRLRFECLVECLEGTVTEQNQNINDLLKETGDLKRIQKHQKLIKDYINKFTLKGE